MERLKGRPSPAMVVAMIALVAALAGTAIAAVPLTKKTVNKIITKRAPGLSVNKAKTADFATTAGNANNASTLNNLNGNDLGTAGAFDQRGNVLALTGANVTYLSATITTPAQKVLTAVASIEAMSDGGTDDNINCNIDIDGVDGPSQSTYVTSNTLENSTTLPLTQGRIVGAGTHTVIAECNQGVNSDTSVEDRNLNVVATG
jgi:hypothetical protein